MRIGFGYDIHPFIKNRPLVLGGVHIPYNHGLKGHSDADVLIHAIMDALLGAAGMPDIGHLFPNTDPSYKGISSVVLLHTIAGIMKKKGVRIINIDSTVIAEAPKIAAFIPAMKKTIANALEIEQTAIGIKATTNEGLGSLGKKEGIAAYAVSLITLKAVKKRRS